MRRTIMRLLKLKGPMMADKLSEYVEISTVGVRGHLTSLEHDGLVSFQAERRGVGRPRYVYSLTEQGDELFPRTYPQVANALLDALRSLEGEEAVDRIFDKRTEWLADQYSSRMMDKDLAGRVKELAAIRSEEGYMADWERVSEDEFILREQNCAILQIAKKTPQACSFELQLFRRVLDGADVNRDDHMMAGDRMCSYFIRRQSSREKGGHSVFAKTVMKLDEVFVEVEDLGGMRAFYKDILGFEEEFYHEEWGAGLRTGGADLVLRKGDKGASGVSLVFDCVDIDLSLRAVTDAGIQITQPVEQGHWGAKVAGFEDPEGNTIHLEQPNGDGHEH